MANTKFQQNELTKKWIQSYKHLNKTKGLSQLKLQKDIGMNQSFISQILHNRVNFPAKYLDKYCKAYRININTITGGRKIKIAVRGRTPARPAPKVTSYRITGGGSIDKVLANLKVALSKQQNGSSANIITANRILTNIGNKLSSLQIDISNIQKALGSVSSNSRGRRTRRQA